MISAIFTNSNIIVCFPSIDFKDRNVHFPHRFYTVTSKRTENRISQKIEPFENHRKTTYFNNKQRSSEFPSTDRKPEWESARCSEEFQCSAADAVSGAAALSEVCRRVSLGARQSPDSESKRIGRINSTHNFD